jgi:hypothetical protein
MYMNTVICIHRCEYIWKEREKENMIIIEGLKQGIFKGRGTNDL